MASKLRLSSLIPAGLVVESIAESEGTIVVMACSGRQESACPLCGRISDRVHSRYARRVSDLPCAGRKVTLHLVARRFFCDAPFCRRRIFAERFEDTVAERSRRTSRLECIVHHLGLAHVLWRVAVRLATGHRRRDGRWRLLRERRVRARDHRP